MGRRNDERFQSPDLQEKVLKQWAEARYPNHGYVWLGTYIDLDVSGSSIERRELNKARDMAVSEGARIVVYDLSRWSRNVPEGLAAIQQLEQWQVDVVSATENFDSATPEGELTLTMFLALAQYQLKVLGASWRRVIRNNRDGGWWHGIVPFGYRKPTAAEAKKIGRTSGVIVKDSVKARHVEELFRRFLAGETKYALGEYGVSKGWFARAGTAADILANPVYCGMVIKKAEYKTLRNQSGMPLKDNHGRPRRGRDPTTVMWGRGQHEAIIPIKTFVRTRQRLADTAMKAYPHATQARWSAAGRTRCGTCGRSLSFHDKSFKAANGLYLICGNRRCPDKPGSVRIVDLEVELADAIQELSKILTTEAHALAELRQGSVEDTRSHLDDLTQAQNRLEKAIANAVANRMTAAIEEDFQADEFDAGLAELRRRLLAVKEEMAGLPSVEIEDRVKLLASNADGLADLWPRMSYDERTRALGALGLSVFIKPSTKHQDPLDGRVEIRLPWAPPSGWTGLRESAS